MNTGWVNEAERLEMKLRAPIDPERHLRAFNKYVSRFDCELLVCYIPNRYQVTTRYLEHASPISKAVLRDISLKSEPYQSQAATFRNVCESLEIPFLDFTDHLKAREIQGIACYWDYDPHIRGETYLHLGGVLYDWMSKLQ